MFLTLCPLVYDSRMTRHILYCIFERVLSSFINPFFYGSGIIDYPNDNLMLSLSLSSHDERNTHVDVLLVSSSGAAHPRLCSLLSSGVCLSVSILEGNEK